LVKHVLYLFPVANVPVYGKEHNMVAF